MTHLIVSFVVFTLIALLSPQILPGIKVKGIGAAALVAIVFGLLNLLIGWILKSVLGFLTLPLTCLTLGLFSLLIPTIVNAILLKITDAFLEPFELKGWWPALGMGLLFGLGSLLVRALS